MSDLEKTDSNAYRQWLITLKGKIRQSQIKAAIRVNEELLRLYWDMGQDIVVRQMESAWGDKFFEKLSADLRSEFPDMKGFSERNLLYIKRFYTFYSQSNGLPHQVDAQIPQQVSAETQVTDNNKDIIPQQVAAEFETHPIFQIPWFHHVEIISKSKSVKEAFFYVKKTIENGWSRAVLMNFMSARLYEKQGKASTNFLRHFPDAQSDLAVQVLKDPYNFDFLTLTENYKEKELEDALVTNITKFLLELGQGFTFVGRQIPLRIGQTERFIDLLFYHLELRCYVVVELKASKFEVEHTAKLALYVSAINDQRKKETDNPTLGLIICKDKDNVEVQYALENTNQPIGISEYDLSNLLPENYKSALPSIEEIEEGLKEIG